MMEGLTNEDSPYQITAKRDIRSFVGWASRADVPLRSSGSVGSSCPHYVH